MQIPTSYFYFTGIFAALGLLATIAGLIWLALWFYEHLTWV